MRYSRSESEYSNDSTCSDSSQLDLRCLAEMETADLKAKIEELNDNNSTLIKELDRKESFIRHQSFDLRYKEFLLEGSSEFLKYNQLDETLLQGRQLDSKIKKLSN